MSSSVTPEQYRQSLVDKVNDLCAQLNRIGSNPPWTKSQLRLFINAKYSVDDGLNSMGGESFQDLIQFLELKVSELSAYSDAEKSLSGPGAAHSLNRAATAAERRI